MLKFQLAFLLPKRHGGYRKWSFSLQREFLEDDTQCELKDRVRDSKTTQKRRGWFSILNSSKQMYPYPIYMTKVLLENEI